MRKILIVDDEQENLDALKRALSDENPDWDILTARNERDGERQLRDQLAKGEPVDVVLTDLVMDTEGSGMNILKAARRIDPLVMAILFTAKERSLDRYAAFDYGAFDVVEKNIRGTTAVREINVKTRAALQYRDWSQQVNFLRRYFDPRVFEVIQRQPLLLEMSERMVTVVFWDIRGFSSLCESLKVYPDLISKFLREYCEVGAKTIFEHDGVLDKFVGDGIMALFGAMNHKDDGGKSDAVAAVRSAIAMRPRFQAILDSQLPEWQLYVPEKIDIGLACGIHTGMALVGNVGTAFRDQFTALGPQVNFASRIQERAERGQILVSQTTKTRLKGTIGLSEAGVMTDVKNIPGDFTLFEVIAK